MITGENVKPLQVATDAVLLTLERKTTLDTNLAFAAFYWAMS